MKKIILFILLFICFAFNYSYAFDFEKNLVDYGLAEYNYGPENTQIIQSVVNEMKEGEVLILPPGTYKFNGFKFNPANNCTLKCYGKILSDKPVVIGDGSGFNVIGLSVHSARLHEGTGVIIHNLYSSIINIKNCSSFDTGIVVEGDGTGCVYNKINLGEITDNKNSLVLQSSNLGWCNQNIFNGGRFTWWSGSAPYIGFTHIIIGQRINNNSFYSLSFEGGKGYEATALNCEGIDNYFYSCRWEMGAGRIIKFGRFSRRNKIIWGYGLCYTSDIINEGFRNCFLCTFSSRLEGGGKEGVLRLCNTSSSYYPSLILETSHKVTCKTFNALP